MAQTQKEIIKELKERNKYLTNEANSQKIKNGDQRTSIQKLNYEKEELKHNNGILKRSCRTSDNIILKQRGKIDGLETAIGLFSSNINS